MNAKEIRELNLAELNDKLQFLSNSDVDEEVSITYFVPDKKKSGGAYVSVTGTVKRIDEYERIVIMSDGKKIPIDEIFGLESKLFDSL